MIILLLFNWFFLGGYKRLVGVFSLVLVFSLSQIMESKKLNEQSQFIIYAVPHGLVLGAYHAGSGIVISDTAFWNDKDALTFHVKHHLWARDISKLIHFTPEENIKAKGFRKSANLIGCL